MYTLYTYRRSAASGTARPLAARRTMRQDPWTMRDTRTQILDAAHGLLAERGIDAVTMRALATRVGITPMAIYRHFADRHDLLDALHDRGFETLVEYFRTSLRARKPERRVIAALHAYVDFAHDHPHFFAVMFIHRVRATRRFPDDFEDRGSEAFQLVADEVQECLGSRVFRRDDQLETTLTIWAQVHGLVMLYRNGRFGSDHERFRKLVDRCINRLLTGLKA